MLSTGETLFDGAASPPLTQMLTILQSRVRLLRWTSLSVPGARRRPSGKAEETIREMGAIVQAIQAKNADAARMAESPEPLGQAR